MRRSALVHEPTHKVFAVNRKGLSLTGGVAIGGVLLLIWLSIAQLDQQKYAVSIIFAVLTTALSDPGGGYSKPGARHGCLRPRRRSV